MMGCLIFFLFLECGRVEETISGEVHMLLACIMLVQKPEATNFLSHCLLLVVSKNYSIILNYYFNCCTNTTNEKHIQQIHYGSVMLEDFFHFISSVFFTAHSSLTTALEVHLRLGQILCISCPLLRAWVTTTCCLLYSFSSRILTLLISLLTTKHCLVKS